MTVLLSNYSTPMQINTVNENVKEVQWASAHLQMVLYTTTQILTNSKANVEYILVVHKALTEMVKYSTEYYSVKYYFLINRKQIISTIDSMLSKNSSLGVLPVCHAVDKLDRILEIQEEKP